MSSKGRGGSPKHASSTASSRRKARILKSGSVTTKMRNKAIGDAIGKSKAAASKHKEGRGAVDRLKNRSRDELRKLDE